MTADWLRRQGRRHEPVVGPSTWQVRVRVRVRVRIRVSPYHNPNPNPNQEGLRRDPHVTRLAAEEERQDGARRNSLVSPTTDDLHRRALCQHGAWPAMRDRKAS